MALVHSVLELIGNTPVARLHSVVKGLAAPGTEVLCKLEYFNPAASIKDRLALAMVEDAEASGALMPGRSSRNTIVEPTSGNTGIGLALVAAVRGYRLILTMPDDLSQERQTLLRGLGGGGCFDARCPGHARRRGKSVQHCGEARGGRPFAAVFQPGWA